MTRDEEARRLALSTAIAKLNAAHDAIESIGWNSPGAGIEGQIGARVRHDLRTLTGIAQADLDALKAKHAAETPEEDR